MSNPEEQKVPAEPPGPTGTGGAQAQKDKKPGINDMKKDYAELKKNYWGKYDKLIYVDLIALALHLGYITCTWNILSFFMILLIRIPRLIFNLFVKKCEAQKWKNLEYTFRKYSMYVYMPVGLILTYAGGHHYTCNGIWKDKKSTCMWIYFCIVFVLLVIHTILDYKVFTNVVTPALIHGGD